MLAISDTVTCTHVHMHIPLHSSLTRRYSEVGMLYNTWLLCNRCCNVVTILHSYSGQNVTIPEYEISLSSSLHLFKVDQLSTTTTTGPGVVKFKGLADYIWSKCQVHTLGMQKLYEYYRYCWSNCFSSWAKEYAYIHHYNQLSMLTSLYGQKTQECCSHIIFFSSPW